MMHAGTTKAARSADPTKRDIFENFRVYGLEAPELVRHVCVCVRVCVCVSTAVALLPPGSLSLSLPGSA